MKYSTYIYTHVCTSTAPPRIRQGPTGMMGSGPLLVLRISTRTKYETSTCSQHSLTKPAVGWQTRGLTTDMQDRRPYPPLHTHTPPTHSPTHTCTHTPIHPLTNTPTQPYPLTHCVHLSWEHPNTVKHVHQVPGANQNTIFGVGEGL